MYTFEFLGEQVQHKKFAQTHLNTIAICNRMCTIPCKQAVRVQISSVQKYVRSRVNVALAVQKFLRFHRSRMNARWKPCKFLSVQKFVPDPCKRSLSFQGFKIYRRASSLALLASDGTSSAFGLIKAFQAAFRRTRFHFVAASFSMRLRLLFTRHRSRPLPKPGRFENAAKSGAFSKRYGFICRVNSETASIWIRLLFWREISLFDLKWLI